MHDVTLLCELSIMLRLACGAQKKGPELNALGPSVFGSFNFGCGDRLRLMQNALELNVGYIRHWYKKET